MHTRTHTNYAYAKKIRIQILTHTRIDTCIRTLHIYLHVCTQIHTYTHTYMHTYIHTYMHTYRRTPPTRRKLPHEAQALQRYPRMCVHVYVCMGTFMYMLTSPKTQGPMRVYFLFLRLLPVFGKHRNHTLVNIVIIR
jgi:hypothetical protein